ncbi:MAG TPA: polymer-forming cytoskeletal protein [Candidatus Limnocylindria bacterium]|nr:polymer-forming cytoskeletal protein [Candidatus Limnocylindria bacterium]
MWSKSAEGKESLQAPQTTAPESLNPRVSSASVLAAPPVSASASATQATGASSTISTGLRIHGEIAGDGDLYIDGEAQGSIRLGRSKVTVGPRGRVQADIDAREIAVEGTVQGNLKASESIRLGGASHVQGSLMTPRVAIEDGASLRGKVETTRASEMKRGAAAGQAKPAEIPAKAPATAAAVNE